jgi:general L-amino acid transport system substrate-binding protein
VTKIHFAKKFSLLLILLTIVWLAAPTLTHAQGDSLLAKVKARGKLICGVNPQIPGFGYLDTKDNTFKGFDPDFCRVLAAGLFGDATKVEYKPIAKSADRFPSLATGDIDVLIRNTTNTFGRDTKEGADFGPTTFYDGATVMVRTADKLTKLEDLADLTICFIKGTTSEQAAAEGMASVNKKFKAVAFDDIDQTVDAFSNNRCDAVVSDSSQLAGKQSAAKDGPNWTIWDLRLTKEPLGPAWKQGDEAWGDYIRWAVYATMILEEKGVTSKNVDEMITTTKDAELMRLLGLDANSKLNENLGLDPKWAYNIVKQVGNYGEIYDRDLGAGSTLKLARGINNLWTKGGLIYAPPFR